jgi:pyrroline-5-carboxylate reductase
MTLPVIAVIGAGNMGSSLIGGLINNQHPCDKLWASDTSSETLEHLQHAFQIHTTTDNAKAAQAAEVIILAVKPQRLAQVAAEIAEAAHARHSLIISIAAGVCESNIQHLLGGKMAIVRAMPNTPALIGCGATALYANTHVSSQQHELAESILRTVGVVEWLDHEPLMDTVTALSGSGPAYFFFMMEALQQAGEQLGLSSETARLLTLQTALGAARMAMESGKSLAELRQNVTSPGGTTEKAISVLQESNLHAIFKKALQAAKLRSEELASIYKEEK